MHFSKFYTSCQNINLKIYLVEPVKDCLREKIASYFERLSKYLVSVRKQLKTNLSKKI